MAVNVLLVRPSDSEGYLHFITADPIGHPQAGSYVRAALKNGGMVDLLLHGQKEFDLPDSVAEVVFPDGSTWKPKK